MILQGLSEPTSRELREGEYFLLHTDFLLPWQGDFDHHARAFAEFLYLSGLSPVMRMAALGGVAELNLAYWVMHEGKPAEEAVARMREWRKAVMQKRAWSVLARAQSGVAAQEYQA